MRKEEKTGVEADEESVRAEIRSKVGERAPPAAPSNPRIVNKHVFNKSITKSLPTYEKTQYACAT